MWSFQQISIQQIHGNISVIRLIKHFTCCTVCLETTQTGRNVDKEFRAGAAKCLETVAREKPDLIVLQSRSPSCGVKQRYDGTFTGTLVDGSGVTAQLLMENGFRCIDVEDL